MSDTKYDLVGAKEAADIIGIGTPNFSHLRNDEEKKGDASTFPKPVIKLACGPIWERDAIETFAQTYGKRKPGVPARPKTNGTHAPALVKSVRKRLPAPK